MGHYETLGFKVTLRDAFIAPIREMYRSFGDDSNSTSPWDVVREHIAFHIATHPGEEAADLSIFLANVSVFAKMERAHFIPFGVVTDSDLKEGFSNKLEDLELPEWEVRCSTKATDEMTFFYKNILGAMITSCSYAWSSFDGDPLIYYEWDGRLNMARVSG